jgi:Zn finger protein HypA/HybF involved in hydrogenase expression
MRGHQEGEQTEVGLLIHSNHITQKWKEREYDIGVCPKCGSFNAIICLDCGSLINEIKSPESKEHHFECPKCKKEYPRYIRLMESQLRQLIYLLGYQIIIDDEEEKQIMYIEEDGTLELKRKT